MCLGKNKLRILLLAVFVSEGFPPVISWIGIFPAIIYFGCEQGLLCYILKAANLLFWSKLKILSDCRVNGQKGTCMLYVVIELISNLIFRPFPFFSPFTVVQSNQILAVFHTKKQGQKEK